MNEKLVHLQELIAKLAKVGVHTACVGGAARDLHLGREPKDYDLVVYRIGDKLGAQPETIDVREAVYHIAGNVKTLDAGAPEETYFDDGHDRGLIGVYECLYRGLTVQVLEFTLAKMRVWNGDPYIIVEEHDCTLNFAWLESSPVTGNLVPRVHGEFPSPYTGNVNEFRAERSQARRLYIQGKFPEFTHKEATCRN